ncbi:Uma2 family endonuclease, partial [Microcoleus sp. T3_A4]
FALYPRSRERITQATSSAIDIFSKPEVGILIDPDEETVTVYRQEGEPIVLGNEDILTVAELFPGWELPIAELWPPIFTEAETQTEA